MAERPLVHQLAGALDQGLIGEPGRHRRLIAALDDHPPALGEGGRERRPDAADDRVGRHGATHRGRQFLGHDDVGVVDADVTLQGGDEGPRRAGGQHDGLGADDALGGHDLGAGPRVADPGRRRLLEQPRPGRRRGVDEGPGGLPRVDHALAVGLERAPHQVGAALGGGAARRQPGGVEPGRGPAARSRSSAAASRRRRGDDQALARLGRQLRPEPAQEGGDVERGLARRLVGAARVLQAERRLQLQEVDAGRLEQPARVEGGAIADALGFEQDHRHAGAREQARGQAAGQAAADDDDVRLDVAGKARRRRRASSDAIEPVGRAVGRPAGRARGRAERPGGAGPGAHVRILARARRIAWLVAAQAASSSRAFSAALKGSARTGPS